MNVSLGRSLLNPLETLALFPVLMARAAQLWALRRAWSGALVMQQEHLQSCLLKTIAFGKRDFGVEASAASGHSDLIRSLRERTGAPIKNVKEVLVKCDWDQDAAFTELRKKGLAAATKKASRVAAEGLLGLAHSAKGAAVVEINSETDFVARNDLFQNLVLAVAKAASALEAAPDSSTLSDLHELEAMKVNLNHAKMENEVSVHDAVQEVAAITGENVKLRRAFHLTSTGGIVSSYLHLSPRSGLARLAGLVSLDVDGDHPGSQSEVLSNIGSSLAMHVVAARPLFLSKELVDPQVLEKEREICRAQASATGKPANVIEKMVEGRLNKYIEEVVLLEQKYVADESKKIKALVDDASKELGRPVRVGSFLRIEVGEGIEKVEKDFAAEVAAAAR